MLTLYHNGEQYPLDNTEYYIRELANGLDEVIFSLNIHDHIYEIINEEEQITDRAGQTYKVLQIDAGEREAKIVCQLDIDVWRSNINIGYNSGTKTCVQQIEAVAPTGWTVLDRAHVNIGRTIEGDLTPYDVCVKCTDVYTVYVRWDTKRKECTIYPKAMGTPVGSFATRELNLKKINYKGKSNNIVTRLYAYGKDGMSFADINGGKPYVDNFTYTDKVLCGIWRDERYTVAADLLADAQEKLEQMSRPNRTYDCAIVDLQATNPDLYNNLDFSLFTAATLIDDVKNNAVDYQVVERRIYPYHPEKNEVIFNSEPLKITASVVNIVDSLENPNSTFQQIQAQRIESATNWLTSGDGYVVARKGPNGEWKELLFMDTDDEATAQKVIRINENGIGFSTTGVNGPYTNAWTIDGQLVADFITTGTMLANRIKGGQLELGGFNNEDGVLLICQYVTMYTGSYSGTTVWCPVGYNQIGHEMSVSIDIFVSNISSAADYSGKYQIYHTTNGGQSWVVEQTGALESGQNAIDFNFSIVNDSNNYYQVGITQDSGYTATYDYEIKLNKAFTSIDNAGINVNGKFTVDPTGACVASDIDVTGGKLAGLNVEYAEKGLSFNAQISGIDCYFKTTAWGGFSSGRDLGGGQYARMDYVPSYGLLKVDYGTSSSSILGVVVTNVGNNTYYDAGDHYVQILHNNVYSSDYGSVSWAGSDQKLKKNIEDLTLEKALNLINSVRPREFEFKTREGKRYGFVAQELRDVLDDDSGIEYEANDICNINYNDFIAPLCMIVKKQQEEIDELKKLIKEAING